MSFWNQERERRQRSSKKNQLFDRLRNKPFWIWDQKEHEKAWMENHDCCFNHIIGLPEKNGKQLPLFDYEKIIYDALEETKHVWIKKATGLGVTEFMLRYIAWLSVRDRQLSGTQVCIVTGPRIELAITLIERMKQLFMPHNIQFDTKDTVIELGYEGGNDVKIEAFPSHHLDAMRGLPKVSFILLDEAAFFGVKEQFEVRDVAERYIAKSSPWIVMISTPRLAEDMFALIELEP